MTEEKALEIWRSLAPIDAMLTREHNMGPGDPAEYEVLLKARQLSGKQLNDVLKLVNDEGLDVKIEMSSGEEVAGEPILAIFDPGPEPEHPAAP